MNCCGCQRADSCRPHFDAVHAGEVQKGRFDEGFRFCDWHPGELCQTSFS
jgi:hypothetical protein